MPKDYAERAKEIDLGNRLLFQATPQTMRAFRQLIAEVETDGALDAKTKELMALARSVALRCEGCLVFHARAAAQKGASRAEVAEALGVALELGGGPAAVYGGEALAAFDQFAD